VKFVDNDDALEEFVAVLNLSEPRWVGVDLEHTRLHAYHGLVCLIQVSWPVVVKHKVVNQTFIIDTLAFTKEQIASTVGKVLLENPLICKVIHGGISSDVWWLAKDFGIRVNSVFDT